MIKIAQRVPRFDSTGSIIFRKNPRIYLRCEVLRKESVIFKKGGDQIIHPVEIEEYLPVPKNVPYRTTKLENVIEIRIEDMIFRKE